MALSTPTALDATLATGLGTVTSVTSASVSPSAGDLLIVGVGGAAGADNTLSSLSTTLSNTSAFTIATQIHGAVGGGFNLAAIAYAFVTGAPGSGTITANVTGGSGYTLLISVCKITGHHTTSPTGVTGTAQAAAGTSFTVTMSGTPAATSTAFGFMYSASTTNTDNNLAPDAAYTELQDGFNWFAAAGIGSEWQTQYDPGSADTTCDFSRPATGVVGAAVVEIVQAPVSLITRRPPIPASIMRNRRR